MILFDTDILSYFSKLNRFHLLTEMFAGPLLVSPNVKRELHAGIHSGYSELKPALDAIGTGSLEVLTMSKPAQDAISRIGTPPEKGETDSLAYCLSHDGIFFTNDRRAYRRGQELGVQCFRLPSLLRILWTHRLMAPAEVRSLISEMERCLDFTVGGLEEIFAGEVDGYNIESDRYEDKDATD